MEIRFNIKVDDIILPFTVQVDANNISMGIDKAIQKINEQLNLRPSLMIKREEIENVQIIN